MKSWTIAALVAAAGIVGLGVALSGGSEAAAWYATPLVVLGGSLAVVCIILWSVRSFAPVAGLGQLRVRRGADRLGRLITELVGASAQADARGVLTLSDVRLSARQELFAQGAELLVAGDEPEALRRALKASAASHAAKSDEGRKRMSVLCRVLPVTALTLALTTVVWMVTVAGGPGQFGSFAPLMLLLAVYGAFGLAVAAVAWGDRLWVGASEEELSALLVIETIVAIRQGQDADRVEALLRGLGSGLDQGSERAPLRKAA